MEFTKSSKGNPRKRAAHRYRTNIENGPRRFSRSRDLEADGFVFGYNAATVRPGQRGVQVRCCLPPPFELQPPQATEAPQALRVDDPERFRGIRRSSGLAEEIDHNFAWLEDGGWQEVEKEIGRLRRNSAQRSEVRAADLIDGKLMGFGPKQSRNILQ